MATAQLRWHLSNMNAILKNLTGTFVWSKILFMEKLTKGTLVTSTSGLVSHFTNDFSITIQTWWIFQFALIQILLEWLPQNFVHDMIAKLLDLMTRSWITTKWNCHQIWIVIENCLVKWLRILCWQWQLISGCKLCRGPCYWDTSCYLVRVRD